MASTIREDGANYDENEMHSSFPEWLTHMDPPKIIGADVRSSSNTLIMNNIVEHSHIFHSISHFDSTRIFPSRTII